MITMLTACTEEIDDANAAVAEILQQLDLENKLLKNSLGIVHCFAEFADTEILKILSEKLPFDMVGCTTSSLAMPGFINRVGLSVSVLTSDTVRFVSGVSETVTTSADGPVTELFKRLIEPLSPKPAMLMPFVPYMVNVGGDEFTERLDALSGGLPSFGAVAISDDPTIMQSCTIYNGEFYPAALAMAALIGDVNPVFFSTSVIDKNIIKKRAVVTESNRNILQKINHIPALQYLESIGVAQDGVISGMETIPFLLYLEDGSRLNRVCLGTNDKGEVILAGGVPVNSTLALASMDFDDVVSSTEEKVNEARTAALGRNMLIYSCLGRFWSLGLQIEAEQQKVEDCISGAVPYHFVYSGGEIFPEFFSNGKVANHLQNHSIIICVL